MNEYVKTARLHDEEYNTKTEFVITSHKTIVDNPFLNIINDTNVRDIINKTLLSEVALINNTFNCRVIFPIIA